MTSLKEIAEIWLFYGLGVEDGCYADWSSDLLVARKVSEFLRLWVL